MKLFQRLLVAPAALGLLAPLAATAAELNINDVSSYSSSRASKKAKRARSFNQFSDVYPTDWSHQTLSKMLQRHDCAPITNKGSMTRYEAAALLNACLENVSEANDEERRLINEFSSELAVIKGRIDGIEAGVGAPVGDDFSTTTKLTGTTIFLVGSADREGTTKGATTFTYKTHLDLETSFDGSDLLKTSIRSGNTTAADPFGSSGNVSLESTHSSSNQLQTNTLFYQFPFKEDFTITVGPRVRQDDMLGVWPSAYPSDSVLDVLTYAGANAAYSLASGAGAGITYQHDNISASFLFVSEEANDASDADNTGTGGGMLTSQGSDDITTQIAWVGERLTVAGVYTAADNGNILENADADDYTAFGLSAVYQLNSDAVLADWFPTSISAGLGWKTPDNENDGSNIEKERTYSFGFLWNDAWHEGNTLGIGIGTAEGHRDDVNYDDPMAYEIFYQITVSDHITVTPAVFVIQKSNANDYQGGLVKTTFTF